MCGFAGIIPQNKNNFESNYIAKKMAAAIEHRGPDDYGIWHDEEIGIALSHQRLAILDLSEAGKQPMISTSGRYVLIFNGEIYNHLELRHLLNSKDRKFHWKGYSDTETLLNLIEVYGLNDALNKAVGMFSLALWDRKNRHLQLARDRVGEKPLYYGLTGINGNKVFVFGSELSALKQVPNFNNSINKDALSDLLLYGAISAPNSIYSNIYQLLPGHLITINNPFSEDIKISKQWWSLENTINFCIKNQFEDETDAINELEKSISKSVKEQSISDVQLGCFLSGGIDSSLITALLQKQSSNSIKTFTIGFEESQFNEAPFANEIANHLGTDHQQAILTAKDAQELIPNLSNLYSEPFADASQLPTHLVCREARKNGLIVALSGDGGDELFGGYNRYLWGTKIWDKFSILPWPFRSIIGKLILSINSKGYDYLLDNLGINQIGSKIHKIAERMTYVKNNDDLYFSLISQWKSINQIVNYEPEGNKQKLFYKNNENKSLNLDPISRMMYLDTLNYLPNDILTKVDRAAMAASLETRSPFLDHRVIENAWRMPLRMKIKSIKNKNISKWALREILYKYVPKDLIERPKAGFGVPIGQWLKGPLKSWANDYLSQESLKNQNIINPIQVKKIWSQHLSGRYDHSIKLWSILMWLSWIDNKEN